MISIIFGIGGFIYVFWYTLTHPSTQFHGFYDKPALLLLSLGPISVILISHSILDFFAGLRMLFSMAFLNQKKEMNQIANQLSMLSSSVRKDGIGVLAQYKNGLKNPFFRDGVTLILNGFTVDEIRHNMAAKISTKQAQYSHAGSLFESLGRLCPGMGLLGTIIGLVLMLTNLNEPAKLGGSMASALLATLYGLIFGSVVYTPISEKINIYSEKMLQLDTMIMEGVLLLKDKKSSAHFQNVVKNY